MGWTTQFLLALIGFHWIPYTIVEFGHLPYFVGALGLFAFAAFTNLHIPLGSVLWLYFKKKGWLKPGLSEILALAILTALLERINPQIFPWHMGYPWMYGGFPAYQTADIWGFTGLSALSYVLNGWILYILINLKDKKILRTHTSYFIIFFSLINVWGYYQKSKWDSFDAQIKILSVQPNIGNQEKQFEIFSKIQRILVELKSQNGVVLVMVLLGINSIIWYYFNIIR
jgi:apolipoprotein N-acyltransferase